jgi:hypothetical protein
MEARCAEAHLDAGRIPEARQAVARAVALLAGSKSEMRRLLPRLMESRVSVARGGDLDQALSTIAGIADLAARRGRAMDSWQARLTAAELELQAHRPGARAKLTALARNARAEGFGLYAREADESLAR